MEKGLRANHRRIGREIASVERAVLAFQAGMVSAAGAKTADGTNKAIILAARLSTVWKSLGSSIPNVHPVVTAARPKAARSEEGKTP